MAIPVQKMIAALSHLAAAELEKLEKATKAALTKKLADDDDSDSDEPAPKAKATPKAKPKAAADSDDDSSDAPAPKAKANATPKAKAKTAPDSDDSSDDEPAPKAKAKATPKAKAKAAPDSDDDDSDEKPAPKAKATPKAKPKAAADSDDDSSDEPAPKAKAKATPKAKAKTAPDSDDSSDDEPAPKTAKKATPKAKPKAAPDSDDSDSDAAPAAKPAAAKNKPAADDSDDDDSDEPPAKKAKVEPASTPKLKVDTGKGDKGDKAKGKGKNDENTVFVGGLPFSATEETVKKDFAECGEITNFRLPLNDEGKPRGIAFITYKDQAGCKAALAFNQTDYGGRFLSVRMAGDKGDKGGEKGKKGDKGDKGKSKGNKEFEVFVGGIPNTATEEAVQKDFAECGEIERFSMPKHEDGGIKGIAFITYKSNEAVEKALAFNGTDYGGRTLNVRKSGDKGEKGDKGKGKDGKGKKGKKGKKDGPSAEKKAAQSGAMVESEGKKQTFGDDSSDDE